MTDLCTQLTEHYFSPDERPSQVIAGELVRASKQIDLLVAHPLQLQQRQALICLIADLLGGYVAPQTGNLDSSELLRCLNSGRMQIAAGELFRFVYVRGRVDERAWAKRSSEHALFSRGRLLLY
jgi:GH24 family phage-related lysozyme (muramidase)